MNMLKGNLRLEFQHVACQTLALAADVGHRYSKTVLSWQSAQPAASNQPGI
jgi:hypothetical protein